MSKAIVKGIYYLLAAALVIFTGWLTVDVGFILFPDNSILPFFMLALFDAGCLSWLLMFLKDAGGRVQRAVSLSGFALDLLGVFGMAAAGMYFSGQTLADVPAWLGQYVLWGVIGYTAVNVTLVYLYHIGDPKELAEIKLQEMQADLDERAWSQVQAQVNEQAALLAGQIQRDMYLDALARMGLSIPATVVDGSARDAGPGDGTTDGTTTGTPANPTKAGKRR